MRYFIFILIPILSLAMSIDEQIQEMQGATSDRKFELMNALKIRIATMNEQERNDAIQKLVGAKGLPHKNESQGLPKQQRSSTGNRDNFNSPHANPAYKKVQKGRE